MHSFLEGLSAAGSFLGALEGDKCLEVRRVVHNFQAKARNRRPWAGQDTCSTCVADFDRDVCLSVQGAAVRRSLWTSGQIGRSKENVGDEIVFDDREDTGHNFRDWGKMVEFRLGDPRGCWATSLKLSGVIR